VAGLKEPSSALIDVVLSTVRAFTGEITPDVRGIAAGWVRDTTSCRVFFDHPPSEDDREMVSDAEAEVIADLYDIYEPFDFQAMYVPSNVKLGLPPDQGWIWIYRRRESWPYDA
jgi:hypothetical protein